MVFFFIFFFIDPCSKVSTIHHGELEGLLIRGGERPSSQAKISPVFWFGSRAMSYCPQERMDEDQDQDQLEQTRTDQNSESSGRGR